MNREDAFSAIAALLTPLGPSGDGTFKTVSRRLALVETLDQVAFPAIYQQQLTELVTEKNYSTSDGFQFSVLNLCWYIYALQPDLTLPTTSILNPLIDAVMNRVIGNLAGGTLQIDGAPVSLRITGMTYWEGVLGDRAVFRIDLQALPITLT